MEASTAPTIVFESAAECADKDGAEALFRQSLSGLRAPGPGWSVKMSSSAPTPPTVGAEADVIDAQGVVRAHNQITGEIADCTSLARTMSDWASGVLRTEVDRAQPEEHLAQPLLPLPAPPSPGPSGAVPPSRVVPASLPVSLREASSLDANRGDEMAPLEVGMGALLMVGGATGGYVGISPFLIDELAQNVFLRPSVAVGESLGSTPNSIWAVGRVDACVRVPGRYASRNGIQLDLCGGADGGFSYVASGSAAGAPASAKTLPYVNIGPSGGLRGEVGSLAVSLRGVFGVNVARDGFVDVTGTAIDIPLVSWRLELDFSAAIGRATNPPSKASRVADLL